MSLVIVPGLDTAEVLLGKEAMQAFHLPVQHAVNYVQRVTPATPKLEAAPAAIAQVLTVRPVPPAVVVGLCPTPLTKFPLG